MWSFIQLTGWIEVNFMFKSTILVNKFSDLQIQINHF